MIRTIVVLFAACARHEARRLVREIDETERLAVQLEAEGGREKLWDRVAERVLEGTGPVPRIVQDANGASIVRVETAKRKKA